MKKETKIVVALLVVFMILTGILSILNFNRAKDINQSELSIVSNNNTIVYSLSEIKELPSTTFKAEIRSTSQPNRVIDFTGVSMIQLLKSANINKEYSSVVFKSVDGFQTVLSKEEVLLDGNVYVAYLRDGEQTLSKSDGGTGPMEVVVALDPFSNRWNKYLIEIELIP